MKHVNKNKVNRSLTNLATAVQNVASTFGRYSESMEKRKNNRKAIREDRRLRGALKHIAKYGKNTALHTFPVKSRSRNMYHEVKQMLNGTWTCSCEHSSLGGKTCYHIEFAKNDARNQQEIAYGQGAVEAHRRLTGIANAALEPLVPEDAKSYKIQFQLSTKRWADSNDYSGVYSKKDAQAIVNAGVAASGQPLTYRMVPINL